jgi:hypothetical protein
MNRPFLVLLLFSLASGLAQAQTLHVPADYPTIQSAVFAAQEGDTVLVSPGIYYENVQLQGRDIVLTSRFRIDQDAALIEQTVIDGSQPVHPDTGSCLLIWKHETAATVIEGFTLRGGTGTVWLDPAGFGTYREGGGILTEFSSPVIRHNIIRDNVIPSATPPPINSTGGGGIRSGDGAPLIEHNLIVHNRADGYGGGIVLNYTPGAVIRNNVIAYNQGGVDFSGGGLWAVGTDQNTVVVFQNNVLAYNEALPGPGQLDGQGGGMWINAIKVLVSNNIVWGNIQDNGKQVRSSGANLVVQYNTIQDGHPGSTATSTLDPLFADTACFQLSPGSPAVDAGRDDAAVQDFSFNERRAAFPARGTLRADQGAYGGPGRGPLACSGALEVPTTFTAVTNSPVVQTPGDSRSINWIDVDGDKDLDLFITNGPQAGQNNSLYKNNGQGAFTAVTGDPIVQDGQPSDGATWADADNDGDADCFVANWYGVNNLFYKNDGAGNFTQILTGPPVTDGGFSETASWGDYDDDGWVDLYVSNSGGNKKNFLYHNNSDATFTKITTGAAVNDAFESRSVNWTDYDGDGNIDLFVTNESNQHENLYRNNGTGAFTVIASDLTTNGGRTMSSSWGDYDRDGDQDVFLAQDQGNDALFRNDGDGVFVKITAGPVVASGGNSFGSQWTDIDNDADLDLFVTNAFGGGPWRNFLFRNDGDGNFTRDTSEVAATDLGWSYGAAFGDFDRDGDLDLAVANCYNGSQPEYLYENHAAESDNHWLVLECIGTTSNRSAIGARVRVTATIGGQEITQMREISAQSGYCGQNQLAPHFGLADAAIVTGLTVEWPSGLTQNFQNLAVDQYLTLTEGQEPTSVQIPVPAPRLRLKTPSPNPFHDAVNLGFELADAAALTIEVADLDGRMLRRLAARTFGAGEHELSWDGKSSSGAAVSAGRYAVIFRQGDAVVGQLVIKVE